MITGALVTTLGTYNHGTAITFSPNTPCKSPTASQQGEPASRIDAQGNYYISGIEGVPAGVDLWYFDLNPNSPTYDPLMSTPQYRGMPDSLTSNPAPLTPGTLPKFNAGGVGGGDVDVAVGFGNYTGVDAPTNPYPALAVSSLTAANVTTFRSLDLGKSFTKNAAGNAIGGVPVNDRQWMQFIGNNDVYLEYRNFGAGVAFIQQSTNGGVTYNQPAVVGTIPQTGYIDVDQHDGTVYVGGNDGSVSVGKPTVVGGLISALTTFTKYQATASTTPANIFFCVRVAQNDVNPVVAAFTHAEKKTTAQSQEQGQEQDRRRVRQGSDLHEQHRLRRLFRRQKHLPGVLARSGEDLEQPRAGQRSERHPDQDQPVALVRAGADARHRGRRLVRDGFDRQRRYVEMARLLCLWHEREHGDAEFRRGAGERPFQPRGEHFPERPLGHRPIAQPQPDRLFPDSVRSEGRGRDRLHGRS